MQHYHVEKAFLGDILTEFPHTPDDHALSVQELLEDRLASGYELVQMAEYADSFYLLIFKVVAK